MAVVYITEFRNIEMISGSAVPIAAFPEEAEQTVAIGGSSVQSNAFNAQTRFIRVHTDAVCSIKVGLNPTATATTMRLPADSVEYFSVTGGDKIAVITNT